MDGFFSSYGDTLLLESTVKVNVAGCQIFKEVHSITRVLASHSVHQKSPTN